MTDDSNNNWNLGTVFIFNFLTVMLPFGCTDFELNPFTPADAWRLPSLFGVH